MQHSKVLNLTHRKHKRRFDKGYFELLEWCLWSLNHRSFLSIYLHIHNHFHNNKYIEILPHSGSSGFKVAQTKYMKDFRFQSNTNKNT